MRGAPCEPPAGRPRRRRDRHSRRREPWRRARGIIREEVYLWRRRTRRSKSSRPTAARGRTVACHGEAEDAARLSREPPSTLTLAPALWRHVTVTGGRVRGAGNKWRTGRVRRALHGEHRVPIAVGESSVNLLAPRPSSPLLKHPAEGRGGCSRMRHSRSLCQGLAEAEALARG